MSASGQVNPPESPTVMVIEDERIIRMLMVETLEDAGYIVIEAGDGPEGVVHLESGVDIDLLVTDLGLPGGMNGREVAAHARLRYPDMKILYVTGQDASVALNGSAADPRVAVITKPFTIASLANKVATMLAA